MTEIFYENQTLLSLRSSSKSIDLLYLEKDPIFNYRSSTEAK